MSNFKLTTDGDLDFSTENLQLVDGVEEIKQKLFVRFRFFQGEFFANTLIGIPYFQQILRKGGEVAAAYYLRKTVATCPGVDRILTFSFTLDNATRALNVAFQAVAIDGKLIEFDENTFIL